MQGIDIEDISRFENKDRIADSKFLERVFTKDELEYCYSRKNCASHLCARFCAKEAVIKVLSYSGIKHTKYNDIEIYHGKFGEPYVRFLGGRYSGIKIDISISHDKTKAIAVAIIK
ncbi:MAG: holo-ACP synthase [Candidatus Gastranaerophilales bacterium]|nr:holo-ACP synthase [Candidatus Gastranaerophilales bacterium]